MIQTRLDRRTLPVLLALALLLIFAVVALIALAQIADQPATGTPEPPSAQSYRARVDALLAIAKPENALTAITRVGCFACHLSDERDQIAPSWRGLAQQAVSRRPPLPADAYIYESIIYPSAFIVDGYADIMPKDFGARLSDQELADMLAYLLSPDAR